MPLQVNEAAINELATLAGVDPVKLKSEIVVEADTPPTETKIKDILANTVIMQRSNYETLLDNTRKSKFDEGKTRALADFTKVALGEKAFDVTPEMKREDVWAKIQTEAKKVWEKESGTPPAEWATEKSKLQGMLQQKEQEYEKLKGEIEQTKETATFREQALAAVSSIPFAAEGEIISKQRDVVLKNILSSYQRKVEDGKVYFYKDGQKLVDAYLNPKTIEEIAKEEAIIFPTKQASAGRGDTSSQNNNHQPGDLDADLKKAADTDALHKLLVARGLSPINSEGQAVIRRWSELHKKSA